MPKYKELQEHFNVQLGKRPREDQITQTSSSVKRPHLDRKLLTPSAFMDKIGQFQVKVSKVLNLNDVSRGQLQTVDQEWQMQDRVGILF